MSGARAGVVVLVGVVALMGSVSADPSILQRPVDRTVSAAADGVVVVEIPAGSVEIVGWERPEVRVAGTVGRAVRDLEVDEGRGRVRVEVFLVERVREGQGADLEIHAPRGSRVDVSTLSADVDVRDVDGPLSVDTASGEISVRGAGTVLEVESLSGDVELEIVGERRDRDERTIRATSASGDVRIRGASGEVRASTVSGNLEVEGALLRGASASSVSGGVRLAAAAAPGARFEVENFSGDVDLSLVEGSAARYRFDTFSGEIDNEFGPAPVRTSRYGPGTRLHFSSGPATDEPALITVRTFSGSIRLRPR